MFIFIISIYCRLCDKSGQISIYSTNALWSPAFKCHQLVIGSQIWISMPCVNEVMLSTALTIFLYFRRGQQKQTFSIQVKREGRRVRPDERGDPATIWRAYPGLTGKHGWGPPCSFSPCVCVCVLFVFSSFGSQALGPPAHRQSCCHGNALGSRAAQKSLWAVLTGGGETEVGHGRSEGSIPLVRSEARLNEGWC